MPFIFFPSPFHFSPVWAPTISPLDCFNNFPCPLLSQDSLAFWAPYSDPQLNLFSHLLHKSPWWKFCSLQMELLIKIYPPLLRWFPLPEMPALLFHTTKSFQLTCHLFPSTSWPIYTSPCSSVLPCPFPFIWTPVSFLFAYNRCSINEWPIY